MKLEVADHEHTWMEFDGGDGCRECPAWRFRRAAPELIDPHPTSLLEQPPRPGYVPLVNDDLQLDVMNDLLEIARPDLSWLELQALATRVIERVQATS